MNVSPHARSVFDTDGSAAVINLKTRKWSFFNPAAGRVWHHLTQGESLSEAIRLTAASFNGLEPAQLEVDIRPIINQMVTAKLLEGASL